MPILDAIAASLRVLLRGRCALCMGNAWQSGLCAGCAAQLAGRHAARCPRCGIDTHAGAVCAACLKRPPAFDAVAVACDYAWPIDALIARMKYGPDLTLVAPLAALLGDTLAAMPAFAARVPQRILPVPLAPGRLRERGFNQALEIARPLARRFGVALDTRSLRRERDSAPQAALGLEARGRNVRGAFSCAALDGLHVAIVDDVMTSGATLREVAQCARRAGARGVHCWVVARTPADAAARRLTLSAVP